MISSARIFGAPVTEPGGKVARTTSAAETPGRSAPSTVDTRWCTPGMGLERAELRDRDGAERAMRPRSLRARSTIITFSATVLRARAQRQRLAAVRGGVGAARSRALDRAGLERVPRRLQEALRRSGDHVRAAEPHERRERRRARRAQAGVERKRVAVPSGAEALGQVHLEHVAGADVVDRPLHGGLVSWARQRTAPLARPVRARAPSARAGGSALTR